MRRAGLSMYTECIDMSSICEIESSLFAWARIPALEAALVKVMDEGRSYIAVDQEATEVTTFIT